MRSVFLVLLLANLLFAAALSGLFGALLHADGTRVETLQPEKLRLIRDADRPGPAPSRRP